MNNADSEFLFAIVVSSVVVLLVLVVFLIPDSSTESHKEIMKHGCGEYHSEAGKWQWKGIE